MGQGAPSKRAKIFDVTRVSCESGAVPNMNRVFVPGAVFRIGNDAVEAFAKANSDRNTILLKYPMPSSDSYSAPESPAPPCPELDTLVIELKQNPAMLATGMTF